jgi:hypothetical protein
MRIQTPGVECRCLGVVKSIRENSRVSSIYRNAPIQKGVCDIVDAKPTRGLAAVVKLKRYLVFPRRLSQSLPTKDSGLTLGRGRRCEGPIIEPERFAYPSGLFGECASGKNRTQNYCEQDDPATGRHDREDQATSSGHYLSVQTTIGRGRRKGRASRSGPSSHAWPIMDAASARPHD